MNCWVSIYTALEFTASSMDVPLPQRCIGLALPILIQCIKLSLTNISIDFMWMTYLDRIFFFTFHETFLQTR